MSASKGKRGLESEEEEPRSRLRPGAKRANILVTGTPGTGKSVLSRAVAKELGLEHIPVSEFAKKVGGLDGWDAARACHILAEDIVLDAMEPKLSEGGCIVEYHACDFFPERWFDLVLVLRSSTQVLYDRLASRDYSDDKIRENVQCEIMDILLQEAFESYDERIVVQLSSNTEHDLVSNKNRVITWYHHWLRDHAALMDQNDQLSLPPTNVEQVPSLPNVSQSTVIPQPPPPPPLPTSS